MDDYLSECVRKIMTFIGVPSDDKSLRRNWSKRHSKNSNLLRTPTLIPQNLRNSSTRVSLTLNGNL